MKNVTFYFKHSKDPHYKTIYDTLQNNMEVGHILFLTLLSSILFGFINGIKNNFIHWT